MPKRIDPNYFIGPLSGTTPGISAFIGTHLNRAFALEGAVSLTTSLSGQQAQVDLPGSRTFTASHKDVIASVLLRYRTPVHGRVSIEPAVGVSVAFGSTTHTNVVRYTYDLNFPSCYPLCPHAERDETVSGTSPGFTGSCDVAVSTVAHVTLVFASRFDYFIDRDTVRPSLGLGPMLLQFGVGARFSFSESAGRSPSTARRA